MTQLEWDAIWTRWYERAVARGLTPNQAVVVADREMTERHGERPGETEEQN